MKIIHPPKIPSEKLAILMLEKIQQGTPPHITDDKKRYLHWDKIRHLKTPDKFDNIEQYWFFIKGSRLQQQKNLSFSEKFSFILTDNIQEKIHQIDTKMHGSIEAKNINENKEKYITHSLIDEAISSSQLEGAATTRKVARNMLKHKKTPKDHSQQMISNNYQAINFINKHKNNDLTPNLILELHQIVTDSTMDIPADAGRLRMNNEIKVVDNHTGENLHIPPDYKTLPNRLKTLCNFANNNTPDYFIHPVIRAIIVHFALAYDHPFTDGNGRTTRALFYWVALKNNYWLFQYITLSTYIKEAHTQYGESFLMTESDDFDLTYFITSQLKFITQSINGLFNYVDKKQHQQHQTLNLLNNYLRDNKINPRQAQLIQHAIKHSGTVYTIEGHKISHNIAYKTARSDLLTLAKLTLLHQSKQKHAFVFIAPNDLEQRIQAYQ